MVKKSDHVEILENIAKRDNMEKSGKHDMIGKIESIEMLEKLEHLETSEKRKCRRRSRNSAAPFNIISRPTACPLRLLVFCEDARQQGHRAD
jgi:hypothetical protein